MGHEVDIAGQTFNRLTAIRRVFPQEKKRLSSRSPSWLWRCTCGKEVIYLKDHVKHGKRGSCGCIAVEQKALREKVAAARTAATLARDEAIALEQISPPKETGHRQRRIPHAARANRLKKTFNLTLEEYAARLTAQGGVCAICMLPPGQLPLCVDHCHTTGRVRGLLCRKCNTALGQFKDSMVNLARALLYMAPPAGEQPVK
jgi:hypothetical protein